MCAAHSANGTPVQNYTSNGATAQQWTTEPDGTLRARGKCLDAIGGTANGTLVDLYACNGTGVQVWQPQSDGALLNPQSGVCLDDPGFSTHRHPGGDLGLQRRRQPVMDHPVTGDPARA
jgi:hypothetical protein